MEVLQVFNDILKHIAKDFTEGERDQWKALEYFHDLHPTSDSVPTLPFSCHAPDSITEWPFERGMPIDWNQAWSVLEGRFDRPHLRAQQEAAAAGDGTAAASGGTVTAVTNTNTAHGEGAAEGPEGPATAAPMPTADDCTARNRVTGGTRTKKDRKRVLAQVERRDNVQALSESLEEAKKGQLYFIRLAAGLLLTTYYLLLTAYHLLLATYYFMMRTVSSK